jgi:hypothetical protein
MSDIKWRRVSKHITEQNIIAALPPKHRLVRVNWKKRKIHIADGFGRIKVISLDNVAS